nr:MAG TPA: minor structural protein [Caudoviricetes sp.]
MKRDFLKDLELTEEQIDKIMAENGKDIEKHKRDAENAKEKLNGIQEQLNKANEEIESYKGMDIEGIKQSAEEWKTKYNTETQALNERLNKQEYEYAVKDYLSNFKFSSDLVKKAIISEFNSKEFKLENGSFLGADDYMKSLQESDPGAFISSDPIPNNTGGQGNFPRKSTNTKRTKEDLLKMPYAERNRIYNENPDEFNRIMGE